METDCPLRILIVEDLPDDAELAERELRKSKIPFISLRVDTKEAFLRALEEFRPDLIVSDYAMPLFNGMQALQLSLAHDPHLPFILLTGSMNEEKAVACMKAGAADYIIKEHIARLPMAVQGALEQQRTRLENEETAEELIAIYENAPLIMMLVDGDRRIRKINGYATGFSCRTSDAIFLMRCGEALRCIQALAAPEGCGFGPRCEECTIRRIVKDTIETGRSHHHVEGELSYGSERQEEKMTFLLSATKMNLRKQALVLVSLLDITDRKRAEEALLKTTERLRRSLAGTVQAISAAVEVKDPYTSGHQKRTADLARAIATEMGFTADRADFVRIATTIHDIGKISVPSEILSKPTKLREIEFGLIKVHPQAGYDILRDIEFPWPVAEVILQHHERMDGSGYPRQLKGDGILMEARIVSVADVVEAIASHRPYRAALGVEAAMEEISKNRNILYDPEVTDACLKLFHEKGYCFN